MLFRSARSPPHFRHRFTSECPVALWSAMRSEDGTGIVGLNWVKWKWKWKWKWKCMQECIMHGQVDVPWHPEVPAGIGGLPVVPEVPGVFRTHLWSRCIRVSGNREGEQIWVRQNSWRWETRHSTRDYPVKRGSEASRFRLSARGSRYSLAKAIPSSSWSRLFHRSDLPQIRSDFAFRSNRQLSKRPASRRRLNHLSRRLVMSACPCNMHSCMHFHFHFHFTQFRPTMPVPSSGRMADHRTTGHSDVNRCRKWGSERPLRDGIHAATATWPMRHSPHVIEHGRAPGSSVRRVAATCQIRPTRWP
jgi:hypothetical protein